MARLVLLFAISMLLFCRCNNSVNNEGPGSLPSTSLSTVEQTKQPQSADTTNLGSLHFTQVQAVLRQLYTAASSAAYRKRHPMPELRFVENVNQNFVANHHKGVIYLQTKTLDALRRLGADSTHALANILGHELSHYFHAKNCNCEEQSSAFLYNNGANIALENQADLEGGFWCYLAGFKVKKVMPRTLRTIYQQFGIPENPPNYPPLSARENAISTIEKNRDTLITLYEIAQPLILAGRFKEAIACLEYIGQYGIDSPEVQNALGACHFLAAVSPEGNYDYTRFPWCPIVFHQTFPLQQRTFRAAPELAAENYLRQALSIFDKTLNRDPGNGPALINKLSTLVCLRDTQALREELKLHQHLLPSSSRTLFEAFSFMLQGKNDLAITTFDIVSRTNEGSAEQNLANFNLAQLKGETSFKPNTPIFSNDEETCKPTPIPSKTLRWNAQLSLGIDPDSKSWCIRLPRSFTMGRLCSATSISQSPSQVWLTNQGYWTAQVNPKDAFVFLHNKQGSTTKKIFLTFNNW